MPLRLSSPASAIFSKAAILTGEIVVLRARWRPRYNLGWRNLVETMAELDVCRSYKHHALGLAPCSRIRKAVEPLACEVRGSWRVDETYDKSSGVGRISAAPRTKPERPRISSFVPSAPNSCIASGNVNSPRKKPSPRFGARRRPDPNERQSPMTWPFVNLHDNLRRSASLKICDLRCQKGGSADVVAIISCHHCSRGPMRFAKVGGL